VAVGVGVAFAANPSTSDKTAAPTAVERKHRAETRLEIMLLFPIIPSVREIGSALRSRLPR
jgi:hypothetical protein